jgi:hypothetical protein
MNDTCDIPRCRRKDIAAFYNIGPRRKRICEKHYRMYANNRTKLFEKLRIQTPDDANTRRVVEQSDDGEWR